MKRFWMSWVQPTEDYRPLTFPPNEAIRGWWNTGFDNDDYATIVAVVDAPSQEEAWDEVRKDWPEAVYRFQHEGTYPEGDRFPLSVWMLTRKEIRHG